MGSETNFHVDYITEKPPEVPRNYRHAKIFNSRTTNAQRFVNCNPEKPPTRLPVLRNSRLGLTNCSPTTGRSKTSTVSSTPVKDPEQVAALAAHSFLKEFKRTATTSKSGVPTLYEKLFIPTVRKRHRLKKIRRRQSSNSSPNSKNQQDLSRKLGKVLDLDRSKPWIYRTKTLDFQTLGLEVRKHNSTQPPKVPPEKKKTMTYRHNVKYDMLARKQFARQLNARLTKLALERQMFERNVNLTEVSGEQQGSGPLLVANRYLGNALEPKVPRNRKISEETTVSAFLKRAVCNTKPSEGHPRRVSSERHVAADKQIHECANTHCSVIAESTKNRTEFELIDDHFSAAEELNEHQGNLVGNVGDPVADCLEMPTNVDGNELDCLEDDKPTMEEAEVSDY
ncbi:hypothetical protein AHF37_06673 [Paragonimus kellicotti]|nr:hypothetical protein AHF37_06673 [Paragonimus kellicotti]